MEMFQEHPLGYFAAIRIRDASISVGNELKRDLILGAQGNTNFAVVDYTQRLQLMGNEKGEIKGILTEWGEVRIGDHRLQTLLMIQTLTNNIQSAAEEKLNCRPRCPAEGKASNQELFNQMRYGRLILNAEIYPCVMRACVTHDAVRKSQI